MSYQATVIKLMIASPTDVAQERQLVREVIQSWNAIHAEDQQIVIMPVGWETHASPQMGDRPQAIINRQVLKNCDLLVAVFWTRLGSPTGKAASGTVEEIEEHLAAGKPALLYFSSAPVLPGSVDNDQYSALQEFKESCKKRGLIEEYEDLATFREKFFRHLAQTIIRDFKGEKGSEGLDLPSQPQIPKLSSSAQELLVEAARDPNGIIMRIDTLAGTLVQTNSREFAKNGEARNEAKWRGAVDELQQKGLVEDRTGKGEVFFVTSEGYDAAVMAKTQPNKERVALSRMMEALKEKAGWTTVERLASKAAVSLDEAQDILRNVPEVVFNKGKDGRLIAKLKGVGAEQEDIKKSEGDVV